MSLKGVGNVLRALNRIARDTARNVESAVKESTEIVYQKIRGRVILPKRVNQQDAPGRRSIVVAGRNPVRKKVASTAGRVEILSHWTKARTRVLVRVFASLGQLEKLVRRGLVIQRPLGGGRTSPPTWLLFSKSRSKWLIGWARKRGQDKRHAVRLDNTSTGKQARRILILLPVLKEEREPTLRRFRRAVRKGLT